MKDSHRTEVVKAIRLVWLSLESHLDSARGELIGKKCCDKMVGLPPFHRKCVKEYAEVISTLTKLL